MHPTRIFNTLDKPTWRFYINGIGYHEFKTFKVYWAYRWFIAEKVDYYTSITPIKKQWGMVIEPTNYVKRYN